MLKDLPALGNIKRTNSSGYEYWSARDIMLRLGYGQDGWGKFKKVLQKAMQACESMGFFVEDHFCQVVKIIQADAGAKQEVPDYFLSKRACHLIAQNGDPRKPEIAAAQNFFAFTAEVYDMTQAHLEEQKRLQLRLKVADENTALSTTALQSGVEQENLGLFHDAGYHGMYTMSSSSLAAFWNLPDGEEILNVMGPEALAANLFRITATDAKLKRDHVTDQDIAIETHHDVGATVRRAVEEIHKKKPEDLPRAASIRKLVEEDRRKGRKARQISQQAEDSGQGTLF